jgi:hypothetical protein
MDARFSTENIDRVFDGLRKELQKFLTQEIPPVIRQETGKKAEQKLEETYELYLIYSKKLTFIWDHLSSLQAKLKDFLIAPLNTKKLQESMDAVTTEINGDIKRFQEMNSDQLNGKQKIVEQLKDKGKALKKTREQQHKLKLDVLPAIESLKPTLPIIAKAIQELQTFHDQKVTRSGLLSEIHKLQLQLLVPQVAISFQEICVLISATNHGLKQLEENQTSLDHNIANVQAQIKTTIEALKKSATPKPTTVLAASASSSTTTAAFRQQATTTPTQTTIPADNFVKFIKAAAWLQNKLGGLKKVAGDAYGEFQAALSSRDLKACKSKSDIYQPNIQKFLELAKLQRDFKFDSIPAPDAPIFMAENFDHLITAFLNGLSQLKDKALADELQKAFKEFFRLSENPQFIDLRTFKISDNPKLVQFAQNQTKLKEELPKIVGQLTAFRDTMALVSPTTRAKTQEEVAYLSQLVEALMSAVPAEPVKLVAKVPSAPSSPTSRGGARSIFAATPTTGKSPSPVAPRAPYRPGMPGYQQ